MARSIEDRFPSEIKITPQVSYSVEWVRDLKEDFPSEEALGCAIYEEKKIKIVSGMSYTRTLSVFMHEALHAIIWEWDLKIYHPTIHKLDMPLGMLLRLNKWKIK